MNYLGSISGKLLLIIKKREGVEEVGADLGQERDGVDRVEWQH